MQAGGFALERGEEQGVGPGRGACVAGVEGEWAGDG